MALARAHGAYAQRRLSAYGSRFCAAQRQARDRAEPFGAQALDRSVKVLQVEGFCERRGAAPAARTLYRDLTRTSGAKDYT
jgi:hypothetical protein